MLFSPQQSLVLGDFRRLALERAKEFVSRLNDELSASTEFKKREPTPLLGYETTPDLVNDIQVAVASLIAAYPGQASLDGELMALVRTMSEARNALDLLSAFNRFLALELRSFPEEAGAGAGRFVFSADEERVYVHATPSHTRGAAAAAAVDDARTIAFLASLSDTAEALRDGKRGATIGEKTAFEVGYALLDGGAQLPRAWQSLGVSGFRGIQTWLSLADPGPGHLDVTVNDNDLLHGTIVHVEHIDRDQQSDKELVEPYRLPASRHAAWVRLHVGTRSPATAFIGRPVFENRGSGGVADYFHTDLLKTSHMHASACTAMFVNGIADCKIGIERMTSSQAIEFMKAVVGNVLRDRERQYLSAAFNINTPLVIDHDGPARTLVDRFEIAMAGIAIARLGGFDKIAWDGASNEIPSRPFTQQLTFQQLVDIVHAAHENGLETYISAGMEAPDMAIAAHAGVDGVGIGTSMHFIDPQTKLMGQLRPEAILAALEVRDGAAKDDLGQGAKLLARLDVMAYEGSLVGDEEALRGELYGAVRRQDGAAAAALRAKLGRVVAMADAETNEARAAQRARRLLLAKRDGGAAYIDDASAKQIEAALDAGDVERIHDVLARLDAKK
ncbi:hypothetical protein [Polyangium aurulentum]|uniref:hypothetical protein n=1 Tax=Polyangium aurulentum TaxID=2567896 RepID=UPI0010ADB1A8|nr:hypothetical protein [Polyangium aurulentum]UQA58372.1 hypothetical protein E8A73_045200 [Polyangium aurulentum]